METNINVFENIQLFGSFIGYREQWDVDNPMANFPFASQAVEGNPGVTRLSDSCGRHGGERRSALWLPAGLASYLPNWDIHT